MDKIKQEAEIILKVLHKITKEDFTEMTFE